MTSKFHKAIQLSFAVLIFSSRFAGVAHAAPVNLIANPSFETAGAGGNPANWLLGGWGTNTAAFLYPVAGQDDASAARIDITEYTDGDAKWYFDSVPVVPGQSYSFSDYYESSVPSSVYVQFKMAGGSFTYLNIAQLVASPAVWSNSQGTFTVPADVTSLTVFHHISQVGYLVTDNFSLTLNEVDTTPSSNLIPNPSLEADGVGGNPASWFRGGWGTNTSSLTYPVAGQLGAKGARIDVTAYTDGDAKWYFDSVPVTPGQTYAYSDYYMSNVPTTVDAQFKKADGTFSYDDIVTVGASPSSWSNAQATFTIPAGVTELSVFHLIAQIGYLSTDNFSLTLVSDAPAPDSNLIFNGSLEIADGTEPMGWFPQAWGAHDSEFTNATVGHNGGKAATVEVTYYWVGATGNSGWQHADVPVTPGTEYSFGSWFTSTAVSSTYGRFTMADGSHQFFNLFGPVAATPAWTFHTASFVAPAGAVSVTVLQLLSSVGTLSVDDVSLTQVEAPPATSNLIVNGSLETADGINPMGWQPQAWGTHARTLTYATVGHDGGKAATAQITSFPAGATGNSGWQHAEVLVTPGTEYSFGSWFSSTAASATIGRFTMADGSRQFFDLIGPAAATPAWTLHSANFVAPAGAVSVTVLQLISSVGTLSVDDVSLVPVPASI